MRRRDLVRSAFAAIARAAMMGSMAMVAITASDAASTLASAGASGVGEPGKLRVEPPRVDARDDAFALRLPEGAVCEEDGNGAGKDSRPGPRSGADSWRWHAFIVEAGRPSSSLQIDARGPGSDYDASDGRLTAVLLDAERSRASARLPAQRPKGFINPNELGGFVLDPAVYTIATGTYDVHVACTDDTSTIRQLWTVTVAVDTESAPFLRSLEPPQDPGGAAGGGGAAPSDADGLPSPDGSPMPGVGSPPAVGDGTSQQVDTSQPVDIETDAGPSVAASKVDPDYRASRAARAVRTASPTGISTGRSVASVFVVAPDLLPVGLWAVLAGVAARIARLLAVPIRVLPPLVP